MPPIRSRGRSTTWSWSEVALTGSDLYFREGTDVTLLFAVKQPEVFKLRMDGFLESAAKSRPDAVRSTGKILGVDYVAVSTPDRAISAWSAYPRANLHVRSNSRAGLARVLAAIDGRQGVARLGDAAEFKYIRTLMPVDDKREDGFIYLSDPFIRRMVGPQVKLTESRRMVCYNHLRMIGHAAMLFRTQFGRQPKSIQEMVEAHCAPEFFADAQAGRGDDSLLCPCGGNYTLSDDGTTGVCSHHGHARQLVPGVEIPLDQVTEAEAAQYRQFVESYNRYWRMYFDPIAVRIQIAPKLYRVETIILPLIDNSVYAQLAGVLGGEPEPLDALPVPQRNIFSVAVRLNKEQLLKDVHIGSGDAAFLSISQQQVEEFLSKGIGNQVAMHVYDSVTPFDLNLTSFLGDMMGRFRGARPPDRRDGHRAVPGGLAQFAGLRLRPGAGRKGGRQVLRRSRRRPGPPGPATRSGRMVLRWTTISTRCRWPGPTPGSIRCYGISLGPVKWRMFYARLGQRPLYRQQAVHPGRPGGGQGQIPSPPTPLPKGEGSKLPSPLPCPRTASRQVADGGPTAHAMLRIRPEHWNAVLPEYRLGWEEGSRQACLENLGPLSSVGRAMAATGAARSGDVSARPSACSASASLVLTAASMSFPPTASG